MQGHEIKVITDPAIVKQLWKPHTKELGIPYSDYINEQVELGRFFGYYVNGHIAGMVTYYIYNKKKEVAMESLVVLPEYRGMHIATHLIYHVFKEVESLIATLGFTYVTEAQDGLPNNLVYDHLSKSCECFTSRSGKMKLRKYILDIDYLKQKYETDRPT